VSATTVLVDGVLIVREGSRRLRWAGQGGSWKLIGMWPDPDHDGLIFERLLSGAPLLVVLDSESTCVPVLREELALPDPLLRQLGLAGATAGSDRSPAEGASEVGCELLDAQVPFLDWLPAEQRTIGEQFAYRCVDVIRQTPPAMLPALLLDELDCYTAVVRFARLTPGCSLSTAQLKRVVLHAFADRCSAVVAAC
jgi:hypothetical protein